MEPQSLTKTNPNQASDKVEKIQRIQNALVSGARPNRHAFPKLSANTKIKANQQLYRSWSQEYAAPSIKKYNSVHIEVDSKLRHAKRYSQHLARPNDYTTITACEALDQLVPNLGVFHDVMSTIRSILYEAIYIDTNIPDYGARATFYGESRLIKHAEKHERGGLRHDRESDYILKMLEHLPDNELQSLLLQLIPSIEPETVAYILMKDAEASKWLRLILNLVPNREQAVCVANYIQNHFGLSQRQTLFDILSTDSPLDPGTSSRLRAQGAMEDPEYLKLLVKHCDPEMVQHCLVVIRTLKWHELDRLVPTLELVKENQSFWKFITQVVNGACTSVQEKSDAMSRVLVQEKQQPSRRASKSQSSPKARNNLLRLKRAATSTMIVRALGNTDSSPKSEKMTKKVIANLLKSKPESSVSPAPASPTNALVGKWKSSIASVVSNASSNLPKISEKDSEPSQAGLSVITTDDASHLTTPSLVSEKSSSPTTNTANMIDISELYLIFLQRDQNFKKDTQGTTIPPTSCSVAGICKRIHDLYDQLTVQTLQNNSTTTTNSSSKNDHSPPDPASSPAEAGTPGTGTKKPAPASVDVNWILASIYSSKLRRDDLSLFDYVPQFFRGQYPDDPQLGSDKLKAFYTTIRMNEKVNLRLRVFGIMAGILQRDDDDSNGHHAPDYAEFMISSLVLLMDTHDNMKDKLLARFNGETPDEYGYGEIMRLTNELFGCTFTGPGKLCDDLLPTEFRTLDDLMNLILNRRMEQYPEEIAHLQSVFDRFSRGALVMTRSQWAKYLHMRKEEFDKPRQEMFKELANDAAELEFKDFMKMVFRNQRQDIVRMVKIREQHQIKGPGSVDQLLDSGSG